VISKIKLFIFKKIPNGCHIGCQKISYGCHIGCQKISNGCHIGCQKILNGCHIGCQIIPNGCHIEWQIRSYHLWRLPNYHFYNVSLQMVKKILIVTPPLIQHILNDYLTYWIWTKLRISFEGSFLLHITLFFLSEWNDEFFQDYKYTIPVSFMFIIFQNCNSKCIQLCNLLHCYLTILQKKTHCTHVL
jgi:hypothetical protein